MRNECSIQTNANSFDWPPEISGSTAKVYGPPKTAESGIGRRQTWHLRKQRDAGSTDGSARLNSALDESLRAQPFHARHAYIASNVIRLVKTVSTYAKPGVNPA